MTDSIFQCALCGFTLCEDYTDPTPASITHPHTDSRDGLQCLRGTLDHRADVGDSTTREKKA